jgi:thiamine monophosphate kinase
VAELIADDRDQFLTETPDIETREIEAISTKDGQKLRSFVFSPKTKGQWERVSYGEEDDFFLVFVVSARTKQALEHAMKDYERFIGQYEKTPNPPLQRTPASGRP